MTIVALRNEKGSYNPKTVELSISVIVALRNEKGSYNLSNLSIYFHATGHRRKVADEPEFDRVANYESENIDFVIEELGAAALIENLEKAD